MIKDILIDLYLDNTITVTKIKKDKCYKIWEKACNCINNTKKCEKLFLKWNECNKNLKTKN